MPETLDDTKIDNFTLLPADDPSLTADEELDGAFIDVEGDPAIDVAFAEPLPAPYGRTWQFDIRAGRFVTYGAAPVELHGKESLKQWIDFTLNIAAGAHSIFPREYGMENPYSLIGQEYSPALEAEFQEDVEQALSVHDRIESVGEFLFRHDDNDVIIYYAFTVRTIDGEELAVQAPFEGI